MENTTNKNTDRTSASEVQNHIGLGKLGKRITPWFKSNRANGYALLILVIIYFAVLVVFTKPILVTTFRQFRDTNIEYAKDISESMGIATASPIRQHINSTIYSRIQKRLIDHSRAFDSTTDTYECQGQLYPTKKAGGKISSSFAICNLTGIFDDLLGNTNQSIDLIGFTYPEYQISLNDKKRDALRQSLIEQFKNNFDYTIRTIFVGQEVLVDASSRRRMDRFRWQLRCDVETNTYFNIRDQHVLYYDVLVDVVAHDNPFGGAGTACDQNNAQPPNDALVDPPDIPYKGPDGKTYIISGDGGGVFALNVKDADNNEHQYGSEEYKQVCGTLPNGQADPYCRKKKSEINGGACGSVYGGDINCGFSDGTAFYGYQAPNSIRVITGCASARTNQLGQRSGDLDPAGYNFIVTTRLVSVGSTFN